MSLQKLPSQKIQKKAEFVWTTQEGEEIPVSKMKTSHLFYTVRMIFNHSVPAHMQILGCKRYHLRLSVSRRKQAMSAMLTELKTRTDLSPFMWEQLRQMASAVMAEELQLAL